MFLLTLPAMVYFIIFKYIPMYGIILPFKDFKVSLGFFKSEWVGFKNFGYLFSNNDAFRITRNTIFMNLAFIITTTVVAIFFALILYELTSKYVKIYQTIFFFPYFISWVVASYVFLSLLDMDYGFVNKILMLFGKDPIAWYNEARYWPAILVAANIWKNAGNVTIIYYTGLMGIDKELYESADIDGASKLQKIKVISIPMLKPIITILVILSIGSIFYSDFGLFYSLTLDSTMLYPVTDVIDTYVYRALKTTGDVGMSSAAALYQSAVGFVLVLVSNRILSKVSPENTLF